ncbi:hypothetical protein HKCCE4037_06385 [Rhodobacterales bacterium HKCCE4037]|nr:hypothetical protein [Rhodobacterales bacterium HKCCE4037]
MARSFLPGADDGDDFVDDVGLQFDRLLDNAHFWATVTSDGAEGDDVEVDLNDNADTPAKDTYFLSDGWQNGMGIRLAWPATNTGAVTVDVNETGALDVLDVEGNALTAGRLPAGLIVQMTYFEGDLYCTSAIAEGSAGPSARFYEVFNLSGTWTKPTGMSDDTPVRVQLWGGGGGGGGSVYGGGGGGYAEAIFRLGDLPASVSITIAAGGAVNSNGGNSTFGSFMTAYGGGAGSGSDFGGGGGALGAGTTGDGGRGGGGDGVGQDAANVNAGGAGGNTSTGGSAVNGGGGGTRLGSGGVSLNGGNGGSQGTPGTAPGGGGGMNAVGAAGRCIVSI